MSKTGEEIPAWKEIGQCCLAARIRVLGRAVTSIFDETMRHHGFTVPQMNILVCVASQGEMRSGQIADALFLDHTTVSRNLTRMIENQWLEEVVDADSRAKPVRITSKGKRLIQKAMPDWRRAQQQAEEFLGPTTAAAVRDRVGQLWSQANG